MTGFYKHEKGQNHMRKMIRSFGPLSAGLDVVRRRTLTLVVRHLGQQSPAREAVKAFEPHEGQAHLPGATRRWRAMDESVLDLNWQQDGHLRGATGRAEDARHDNVMRAGYAVEAVHAYNLTTSGRSESHIADLLGDLMHLCDAVGEDFEAELQRAHDYYEAERLGRL